MFMLLPSFVVKFEPEPGQVWNWRVLTEEGLEAFCKVLRLNGVESYEVSKEVGP
jgi:hypothetical protein